MQKIISVIVLLITSMTANAYQGLGLYFPSEQTMEGLPQAIPCGVKEFINGMDKNYSLQCVWYYQPRDVKIWDEKRQQDVIYSNQFSGRCIKENCRDGGGNIVGHWSADIPYRLSLWYYIDQSTDGKPVAYRLDSGPAKGQDRLSYVEAGKLLHSFYEEAGAPESTIQNLFGEYYVGGYKQYLTDLNNGQHLQSKSNVQKTVTAKSEWPDVKSAWCNPRADDDCYINNKKVPIAELGKWLPDISESNADQLGGRCETILCFDKDDQLMGYLLQ
ncbi:hypothetical protein M5G20_12255 [Pseudomonas sp. TNT2022 ID1044]|uniref:hypothetical protein n=1 Tax=Pseudomonas sp. TNT2022 ID1044 TaxID=2942636 RepID=UPI002361A865|nr:hypothetical protein [Pseudomonas sp. TNT2022 ID1044]MDD0996643.1 hypothetical protein [Pseudomonas sp. TNT2022 ID1044]